MSDFTKLARDLNVLYEKAVSARTDARVAQGEAETRYAEVLAMLELMIEVTDLKVGVSPDKGLYTIHMDSAKTVRDMRREAIDLLATHAATPS